MLLRVKVAVVDEGRKPHYSVDERVYEHIPELPSDSLVPLAQNLVVVLWRPVAFRRKEGSVTQGLKEGLLATRGFWWQICRFLLTDYNNGFARSRRCWAGRVVLFARLTKPAPRMWRSIRVCRAASRTVRYSFRNRATCKVDVEFSKLRLGVYVDCQVNDHNSGEYQVARNPTEDKTIPYRPYRKVTEGPLRNVGISLIDECEAGQ